MSPVSTPRPPAEASGATEERERALAPAVGVALLVCLTALLAAVVGTVAFAAETPTEPPPRAALSLDVDADADRLTLVHRGGDALAVNDLGVRVTVDGRPLAHQPPVPFFAAAGFVSGPTGPFNPATDGRWTAGERTSLRLAGTNGPAVDPGDAVTVRVTVRGHTVANPTARAG